MKLYIRAHDLGVKNAQPILDELKRLSLDGVQLVCYKAFDSVAYEPGVIAPQAKEIGRALSATEVAMIGAYFNPVHSSAEKVAKTTQIFREYLENSAALGCDTVGSETGSFNDDKWTYHPRNRTSEALDTVIGTFGGLCEHAAKYNAYVAIEGAAGHVCYEPEVLSKAKDEIGSDRLKIIFDLYNYMDENNYQDYKNILDRGLNIFDRIHCYHIKDCVFGGGKPAQVSVGRGQLDFDHILSQIKQKDPDARLILEGTTGEDIAFSARFIREKWEKV